ncbi:lipid-A-disaccharide synthase [Rhizobium sp. RU36D]|uniref:lipid-A-disaccharide synthase n=1 Tax=Rhizobium sp. RU36D TaxID=1907415 RepID=UPI0009D81A7D|nr:lipid-A-disaccharide synthase [Rhizobium sp. RU36D]SMC67231.1 lipid-A-disaccharide synthase [Rhizobium sp. RU36D]
MTRPLKIAVIAGEVSGDLLGGDIIARLKQIYPGEITLVGVGGEALIGQGLTSLFDFSELSVMGLTQVLKRLPRFIQLIGLTSRAIIAEKPDLLLIIDSPDFTHRVARKVRAALPDLPIVNYVCPSVWAWKEYRAKAMLSYVDRVLAVLPFEPEVMQRLGGPETLFIGHRLTADRHVLETRQRRAERPLDPTPRTVLLLPGSRRGEISALLPVFGEAMSEFVRRNGETRFILPTVPRQEALVRQIISDWSLKPEIVVGQDAKWRAFAEGDAAMAASGTVLLELALCGIPAVSTYKGDMLMTLFSSRIRIWTAALPNLIADYAVIPEYMNAALRPGALVRWMERLTTDTIQREVMQKGFDTVWARLRTEVPPGEAGARHMLDLLRSRNLIS